MIEKRITENKGLIRAIIRKFTGSYNEDIEQEVYIKTWRNMDTTYVEEGKFKQWIGALTANVCRDYFKSRQYKQRAHEICDDEVLENVPDSASQEETLDAKMRQKIILRAVDDLPSKMKKVIILFEFEGHTLEQIAKKTGVPVGTVKSRLFNAKKILSTTLRHLKNN